MAKSTGLRTEILITLTLLMGAALLLGGALMLRLTEQGLLAQKTEQLRILTKTVATAMAKNVDSGKTYDIELLKQLPEGLVLEGWSIYDQELQQVTALHGEISFAISAAHRQQVRLSGLPFERIEFPPLWQLFTQSVSYGHFIYPIYQQDRFRGLLEIRYSLQDVRERLSQLQQLALLYVFLYGGVLVCVGYYLLQRNVVQPASGLLRATEEVSRGNLETRLPIAGPSEIASLASAYNRMVEALKESRMESREYIENLERTNQELKQTRNELVRSEKLASVGQLAAGLAHELGNPLAALIGYLEVLKSRFQGEEGDIINCSLAEAERIDFLVRELLDFSRPAEQNPAPLDPVIVIKDSIALLNNQGVFAGIEVNDRLPDRLPLVCLNASKLQQVFVNLLLNAADACEGQGAITLSADFDVNFINLNVADTGHGIPSENSNKVFDPFFTTKSPGQGTGLGLAICYRLLEEAGGSITLTSEEGKGSCFRVELPICR